MFVCRSSTARVCTVSVQTSLIMDSVGKWRYKCFYRSSAAVTRHLSLPASYASPHTRHTEQWQQLHMIKCVTFNHLRMYVKRYVTVARHPSVHLSHDVHVKTAKYVVRKSHQRDGVRKKRMIGIIGLCMKLYVLRRTVTFHEWRWRSLLPTIRDFSTAIFCTAIFL